MSTQSKVYVNDKEHGWLPANVISYQGGNVTVSVDFTSPTSEETEMILKEERIVQLKEYEDGALPLQNIDESGNLIVVPDMCDLPSLHEVSHSLLYLVQILFNVSMKHDFYRICSMSFEIGCHSV